MTPVIGGVMVTWVQRRVAMSSVELANTWAKDMIVSLPLGVLLVSSVDGRLVYANPKAAQVFGYAQDELTNLIIEDLIPAQYREAHQAYRQRFSACPRPIAMNSGRVLDGLKKSGASIQLQMGITPIDHDMTMLSFIEMSNDIIKPATSNDALTGLANRHSFESLSEGMRRLAIRNRKNIAIAFLDLNQFKPVNDQYGHKVGDALIMQIANTLTRHVRASDVVARVGGDEFIICLYDMASVDQLAHYLNALGLNISAIKNVMGQKINISASIGAVLTDHAEKFSINEMVHLADQNMYRAKQEIMETALISALNNQAEKRAV